VPIGFAQAADDPRVYEPAVHRPVRHGSRSSRDTGGSPESEPTMGSAREASRTGIVVIVPFSRRAIRFVPGVVRRPYIAYDDTKPSDRRGRPHTG
jgi:hypothetical protein